MFSDKPVYLMGIVNVTPDSFSDGGAFLDTQAAIAHARRLIAEGADIIDIGGESTRPNAAPVTPAEEQSRILTVIAALKHEAVISVDTRNAATMRAALEAGAHMLNDVSALTHDPQSIAVAAAATGPVCLMHIQGTPATMQQNPTYTDVVQEVYDYLAERIAACEQAGIARSRLVIDPGFGFGKTFDHNAALLAHLRRFTGLGVPILAGLSRKRFVTRRANAETPEQLLAASVAAALEAHANGARILRVHDVAPTRAALVNSGS